MRSGNLRHRLVILTPSETRLANGDTELAFTEGSTVWGSVEPLQGRELWLAAQVRSDVTHTITMRWNDATKQLTAKHRIRYGTRVFEVGPPLTTDERNFEIVLTAIEKQ